MPRNRAKRDAKNSRSAERGCSFVLPAAEQAANGWSPQPCLTPSRLCRVIAQSAMQKTAGAPSEAVPLFSRRRTGGEWLESATLPYPQQAMPRNRAKRDAKNSRSAERGCSSVLPAAEQAANGWSPQPCPTTSRLCRAIAQRCTNSSPPQNAARCPIRRWNIPLCTSFVYISHKIHAQSLSYCYVGVDLLRQIAYT